MTKSKNLSLLEAARMARGILSDALTDHHHIDETALALRALDAAIAEYSAIAEAEKEQPVAWLYTNTAGVRITHYADRLNKQQLDNDMKAATEYPQAHSVTPLYLHPKEQK